MIIPIYYTPATVVLDFCREKKPNLFLDFGLESSRDLVLMEFPLKRKSSTSMTFEELLEEGYSSAQVYKKLWQLKEGMSLEESRKIRTNLRDEEKGELEFMLACAGLELESFFWGDAVLRKRTPIAYVFGRDKRYLIKEADSFEEVALFLNFLEGEFSSNDYRQEIDDMFTCHSNILYVLDTHTNKVVAGARHTWQPNGTVLPLQLATIDNQGSHIDLPSIYDNHRYFESLLIVSKEYFPQKMDVVENIVGIFGQMSYGFKKYGYLTNLTTRKKGDENVKRFQNLIGYKDLVRDNRPITFSYGTFGDEWVGMEIDDSDIHEGGVVDSWKNRL